MYAKICYALPTSRGQQFFLLFPEAYLLTGGKKCSFEGRL